jgi:hypothetical protein
MMNYPFILNTQLKPSILLSISLYWWWQDNGAEYPEIEQWVINLDGGPATRSDRTQFIKRMVELSQSINITVMSQMCCQAVHNFFIEKVLAIKTTHLGHYQYYYPINLLPALSQQVQSD